MLKCDKRRLFYKRYLCKVIPTSFVILIILLGVVCITSLLTQKKEGVSVENQINYQFSHITEFNYDLIFLGNSRIYRGINPSKISINSYNFAFDNDTFVECLYKLKYLDKIETVKVFL